MPSNREIQFILSMKDLASSLWEKFSGRLQKDATDIEKTFRRVGDLIKDSLQGGESITSLEAMRKKLKNLQTQFDQLPIGSENWKALAGEIRKTKSALDKMEAASKSATANIDKSGTVLSRFGGILTTVFTVAAAKQSLDAFMQSEQATSRLAQSLANVGVVGSKARKDLEDYAAELQKKTKYEDDSIKTAQSMLISMTGLSGDGIKPLTQATLDLATGLGMDLNSAAQIIGKTVDGSSDALKRYGISTDGVSSKSERLQIVIDRVRAKFGGFAENEGKTTAGRLEQLKNQVGDLQESLGMLVAQTVNNLQPALTIIVDWGGRLVLGALGGIKTFIATVMTLIVGAIATIEEGLNTLGITNSKTFQRMRDDGVRQMLAYSKETVDAFKGISAGIEPSVTKVEQGMDAVDDAGKASANSLEAMRKRVKDLETDFGKLPVGSAEWKKLAGEIAIAKTELDKAEGSAKLAIAAATIDPARFAPTKIVATRIRTDSAQMNQSIASLKRGMKDFGKELKAINQIDFDPLKNALKDIDKQMEISRDIAWAVTSGMRAGWDSVFAGEPAGLKNFFRAIANTVLDAVEMQMMAAYASALAQSIFSLNPALIIKNLVTLTLLSGSFAALKAFINGKFHEGGVVPKPVAGGGMLLDAPASREFPILVRGGETIRTERQESILQRQINNNRTENVNNNTQVMNLTVNFNSPVPAGDWIIDSIKRALRQAGVTVDRLLVNQRANVAIA